MTFLHKLSARLARIRTCVVLVTLALAAAAACEYPLAIVSAAARLFLSPKNSTLRAGQVTQFYAVGLGGAGDTVAYSARWTVSGGTILDTGTNGGRHYVSYRSPDQPGRFAVVSQSATTNLVDSAFVDVTAVPVASVLVDPLAANFTPGQTLQFGASLRDANGTALSGRVVTWSSSNTAVATVNGSGLVTAVAGGSATITATSEGQSGSATAMVIQTAAPVASVTVAPASPTVAVGQTVQLVATARDAGGTALAGRVITWGSGNPSVALVGGAGMVTGIATGSATITATSEGKSGTASVTVTQPVASVTVTPASATVRVGQSVQLVATPRDAAGTALTGRIITWGSNNTPVATVTGSGVVTVIATGTALITATSEGKSGSSAITVPWPNEPAGFRVISDYDFASLPGGGWNSNGPIAVSDASAPVSAPGVAQWFYPQGMTAGVSPGTVYYPATFSDHFIGYDFKYSNPYSNQAVGTKQWYPYDPTADYFVLFNSSSKIQVDVQAPTAQGGSYNLYGNVNDPTITLGVWHRFELYFKRASSSSTKDGIIRWWIDGTLCGNYTNVAWPQTSYQEMRITPTWGGIGGNVGFNSYWWVDHIRVSQP